MSHYTVQLLEEQYHGCADWQTYAVRDEHNVCVCIVGEVDHLTAPHNLENARHIAQALEHNCSNSFCTIRENDYPDIRRSAFLCRYCGNDEKHEAFNTCTACGRLDDSAERLAAAMAADADSASMEELEAASDLYDSLH